jgi:hypothetical protein
MHKWLPTWLKVWLPQTISVRSAAARSRAAEVWCFCGWSTALDPTGSTAVTKACGRVCATIPCGARRRRSWSVTRPHATRRSSGTPRDSSRQRKGLPWSETQHDSDGEQLGARCKAEGLGDKIRVVGVDEVVCARVPEGERVHELVRRSRASAERLLLTTGFRSRQAERRSGSAHTRERVHRTRARRAKATAWSSSCTSVRL